MQSQYGKDSEYDHPFYKQVYEMLQENDHQAILEERVPLKLLRLEPAAQEGFILTDYPNCLAAAEMLEEYKGGLNSFVHLSLPDEVLVDIEETKVVCPVSGRVYYKNDVINEEHGVRIDKFVPEDGHDYDSGSTNFEPGSDPAKFEKELEEYHSTKADMLAFYNEMGLLVDFEPRRGYEDFDKLKRQIQYNVKH